MTNFIVGISLMVLSIFSAVCLVWLAKWIETDIPPYVEMICVLTLLAQIAVSFTVGRVICGR